MIIIGRIGAPFGVRGWVKLLSYTEPSSNIVNYHDWHIGQDPDWRPIEVDDLKPHGIGFIAKFRGCDDRDRALLYKNTYIAVDKSQLPPLENGTYYWHDLVGLEVVNQDQIILGQVQYLFSTGSNDVLVVSDGKKEHLIPYLRPDIILSVDVGARQIRVHWDPDF
jgi:16S rRNA processing protein RimM